jgi:hypothetical protein
MDSRLARIMPIGPPTKLQPMNSAVSGRSIRPEAA